MKKPKNPPPTTIIDSHEVLVKLLGELVGVAILAIVADSSEQLGKIAVALMLSWLLVWVITNPALIQKLTGKL